MKNKVCGIYMIKNLVSNKVYIGQSIDIYDRWKEHICSLRGGYHVNSHLQRSWNKYKEHSFEFSIIEECDESVLNDREIFWITENDSYCNGYNQTKGGGGVRGFKHTYETKQKISESLKGENAPWYGKQRSEETKIKVGLASKERWTDEFRAYMSSVNTGRMPSEDTKRKMSESQKKRWTDELRAEFSEKFSGKNNPMYGVQFFGENNPNYGNHKLAGENNPNCHPVYCPELDEVFWGIQEAVDKYGVNKTSIVRCCTGKQKHAGKHPTTGIPLRWVYNDEKYKLNNNDYSDARIKTIYCIELDEYFISTLDANEKYGINRNSISQCCLGNRKSAGKHPQTNEKLHWVYVDEMNNSSVA